MHVLRAEKGYIIVGQDTDGTVTPDDVGLAWAIGQTKADFVGKRSLERPAMRAPQRKQLVGSFAPMGRPARGRRAGGGDARRASADATHRPCSSPITAPSSDIHCARPRCRRTRTQRPNPLRADAAGDVPVQVVSPVFYDREGARLNG